MRSVEPVVEGTAEIVDGTCTLAPRGRASVIVARVLGRRVVGDIEEIYLDRLIHETYQTKFCGYAVRGAVSTILLRRVDAEVRAAA